MFRRTHNAGIAETVFQLLKAMGFLLAALALIAALGYGLFRLLGML